MVRLEAGALDCACLLEVLVVRVGDALCAVGRLAAPLAEELKVASSPLRLLAEDAVLDM